MPKIRALKPDFWTDDAIVELSPLARLLFQGLWTYACDNGHVEDKPRQIKMRILPADDISIGSLLDELSTSGRIVREEGWITVPNFSKHQKVDKRFFTTCSHAECAKPGEESTTSQRESRRAPVEDTSSTRSDHDDVHASSLGGCDVDGDVDSDGDVDRRAGKPRKKPSTRLSSDWKPTTEHLTRALESGVILAREVERFRLHAETHDRRAANWNAAFTQWLIKAAEYAAKDAPAPTRSLPRADQIVDPPPGLSPEEYDRWFREQVAMRKAAG